VRGAARRVVTQTECRFYRGSTVRCTGATAAKKDDVEVFGRTSNRWRADVQIPAEKRLSMDWHKATELENGGRHR